MGGFRFEAITLSTPGTIVLSGAGVQFGGGYLATPSDYQGYFESSSGALNTMFYDGAYTEQTDMQPAGTNGATQPSVLDGAKRDRAIWSGDLGIEGQGIADTLGSNGNDYVKQSLLTLITSSPQGGGLNADTLFRTGPYSDSYPPGPSTRRQSTTATPATPPSPGRFSPGSKGNCPTTRP